jgi:hypothetical protein
MASTGCSLAISDTDSGQGKLTFRLILWKAYIFSSEIPKINIVLDLYQGNFPALSANALYILINVGQGLNIMYSRCQ